MGTLLDQIATERTRGELAPANARRQVRQFKTGLRWHRFWPRARYPTESHPALPQLHGQDTSPLPSFDFPLLNVAVAWRHVAVTITPGPR